MADLSKIKLNGTEYDLKDAVAREQLSNIVFVTFTDTGRDYTNYEADMTYLECLSALNNGKKLIGVIINRYYNRKSFAFCKKPNNAIHELYFYYWNTDHQIKKIIYDNNNNITFNIISIPKEILLTVSDDDGNPFISIDPSSLSSGNNCENPYALHGIDLPNGEENRIEIINQSENYDKNLTFNLPSSSGTFALTSQIPILEPIANVESMLTSFGLNAAANLAPAQAGTAEIGKAVVQ